jgi:hypothetical protein
VARAFDGVVGGGRRIAGERGTGERERHATKPGKPASAA